MNSMGSGAISSSDFRLFFNRFVRVDSNGFTVHITNVPEFNGLADRAARSIIERLKDNSLSELERCKLLDDLGTISILATYDEKKSYDENQFEAIQFQNKYLERSSFLNPGGSWKLAHKQHPLVHGLATHWRGIFHGPPSPLDMDSKDAIAEYLLEMASKTPSVIDKKRIDAAKDFLKNPPLIRDALTTEKIKRRIKKNWLDNQPKVVKPSEDFKINKILPDELFRALR
jgi:hypothetical protein